MNENEMKEEKIEKHRDIVKIVLICTGVVLLFIGLNYHVPSREFSFLNLREYVGGDAYNGMIEASIRGGEIAGALISKTVYICSGIITIALGLMKRDGNK